MRTLYLECNMGAAGDMLMAALLELHPHREDFLRRVNQIGLPHVTISAQPAEKCGIVGTHMKVEIKGQEEGGHNHGHDHGNSHDHSHPHVHMSMEEITAIIDNLRISEKIRADIKNIYQLIARAESTVHGKPISEVHFHEVGMLDAIADITGCAMLISELGVEKIITSPINVGFGEVHCAHGILPVPAPATALLLQGIPCYAGETEGELCTPTGAALLKHFTSEFERLPQMTVEKTGYGCGKKDFPAANCIRAMLGETEEEGSTIAELCCNLDDMTPEELGFVMELLFENGALDVFTTAIGMKKSRPGTLLTVMCKGKDREKMAALLFRHTTTIGIRESIHNRMVMHRTDKTVQSKWGTVHVKECTGYGVKKEKPEYEDIRKIAKETGLSLKEIKESLISEKEKKNSERNIIRTEE